MAKPVTIKILGDASGLSKALGTAQSGLGKFAKNAAFAGVAVAGAVGAGLFKLGQESEKMTAAIVKGTGAVGDQLAALEASALEVMSNVPEGGEVVATALADVNTRLGLTGEELEGLTETALDFARLTDQDVTGAVNGVADVMGVFALEAGEAEEVMGDLLRISQASGTPVSELTAALSKQGGTLAALGLNAEEATEFLADLGASGVPIRKAGAGVEYFTDQMLAAGKDPRAEWDLLQEAIKGATTDLDAQRIATEALGPAGLAMVGPIREGQLEIGDLAADSVGVIGAQAGAMATLGEKFAEVSNKVKSALIPVADVLMDKLAVALEVVTNYVIENFPKWREAIEPVITAVVDGIKMFASVLRGSDADDSFISKFAAYLRDVVWPLVIDIKDWIIENWPAISAVFRKVATFIVEEVMPRVVKAIKFVAEVIGDAIAFVVEHWPEISAVINKAKDFIVDEVFPRIVAAVQWLQEAIQAFVDKVKEFWAAWGEDILATATRVFDLIKEYIGGALDQIKAVFDIFKGLFTGDWAAMWDGIVDFMKGFGTRLKATFLIAWEVFKLAFKFAFEGAKITAINIFNGLKTYITDLPGNLKDLLVAGVSKLAEAGTDLATALFDAIKDKVAEIPGMVGGLLKDIGGGILGGIGGALGFGGDDDPTTNAQGQNIVPIGTPGSYLDANGNNVSLNQHGGPLRPGLALVGERGPELLNIPNSFGGGSVTANEELGGLMGGVTVNVSTNADPVEIGSAVAWELRKAG